MTVIARQDKPIEDKLVVYHILIDDLLNISKIQDAADISVDILARFNCRFPRNSIGVALGILGNVLRGRRLLPYSNVDTAYR